MLSRGAGAGWTGSSLALAQRSLTSIRVVDILRVARCGDLHIDLLAFSMRRGGEKEGACMGPDLPITIIPGTQEAERPSEREASGHGRSEGSDEERGGRDESERGTRGEQGRREVELGRSVRRRTVY